MVHTVYVNQDVAVVIQDGQEVFVINYHVINVVQNMDSVKMGHVFVHKAGMEDIVHYVSRSIYIYISFERISVQAFFLGPINIFEDEEEEESYKS